MDIKNMKIKSILPQGVNKVNHSIRIKLGLSCEEYCIFETILSRKRVKKDTKFDDIEDYTGLLPTNINTSIRKMINILLIKVDNENFMLNKSMVDSAFKEQENKFQKEFNKFWKITKDGKEINCWPGPREDAFNKFKIARNEYSFEFIMQQRFNYFKLLEHKTWRNPMQASKFLNVKTKQVEEDFKSQWPEHFKIAAKSKNKVLTKKEKEDLYK